jgi:hypothetical protein
MKLTFTKWKEEEFLIFLKGSRSSKWNKNFKIHKYILRVR